MALNSVWKQIYNCLYNYWLEIVFTMQDRRQFWDKFQRNSCWILIKHFVRSFVPRPKPTPNNPGCGLLEKKTGQAKYLSVTKKTSGKQHCHKKDEKPIVTSNTDKPLRVRIISSMYYWTHVSGLAVWTCVNCQTASALYTANKAQTFIVQDIRSDCSDDLIHSLGYKIQIKE